MYYLIIKYYIIPSSINHCAIRRNSITSRQTSYDGKGGETLENIRRVTERQDSVLGYYYKNDKGDLVMVNIYDISETDPADILGNDILDADPLHLDPEEVHDRLKSVPMDRFMSVPSNTSTSSSSGPTDSLHGSSRSQSSDSSSRFGIEGDSTCALHPNKPSTSET